MTTLPDGAQLWPVTVLRPSEIQPNPVPFSRSGGVTLGGIERSTRTDRGYWSIAYVGVALHDAATRRMWNGLRASLSGTAGLLAVPVWSYDVNAALPQGELGGHTLVTHSDGARFSDGARYAQPAIVVEMAIAAAIGDTSVSLRLVDGIDELTGTRFSYNHALYELGLPTAVDDDVWTVPVIPAIRAAIPQDAVLEFDMPTCLVRLASDREMDTATNTANLSRRNVAFKEAVDYWNDLALS